MKTLFWHYLFNINRFTMFKSSSTVTEFKKLDEIDISTDKFRIIQIETKKGKESIEMNMMK